MIEKKLAFPFRVEPFQEDYTGRLSWSNLGNQILRASSLHAEAHGFGHTYMKEHRQGWVLARLILEVSALPRTGDDYAIATWVKRIFGQFTDRLYTISGADGRIYGHGTSTWALIDYATRQPVNLETLPNGGFTHVVLPEEVPVARPSRGRCVAAEPVLKHTAVYSDLDINGHVNSIRYIDMVLDTFPKAWHDRHRVARIEMSYGLEGYCGDRFHIFRDALSEHQFAVRIVRPASDGSETIIARSIVTFAPMDEEQQ